MFETIRPKRHRQKYRRLQHWMRENAIRREHLAESEHWLTMSGRAAQVMIKKALGSELTEDDKLVDLRFFF